MKLNKVRNLAFYLSSILLVSWVSYFLGLHQIHSFNDLFHSSKIMSRPNVDRSKPSDKSDINLQLFWTVWDDLQNNFLFTDNIDYQKMIYGAIKGMTSALDDPYTAFYPPSDNETSKEDLNGAFFGVGIQLGYKNNDQLAVIAPLAGMPAEKQGVQSGDYILHIKDIAQNIDEDTYGMGLLDAVKLIRGPKDTEVILTLLHQDENSPYEATIKREEIVVPSVEVKFGQMINETFTTEATGSGKLVARLQVSRFGGKTEEQWDQAISKIMEKKSNLAGIVLDLRNNPGGYMNGAINLDSEFIPKGKDVVIQTIRTGADKSFKTTRLGRLLNMPLVVLMNQGSASASEIMAGALQDYQRAKIVGVTSFGKGIIQSTEDFNDGSGLHITFGKWLTPNRRWIHKKGLDPDVEVKIDKENPVNDVQLNKATQMILDGSYKY